jgi:ketosteroid isomerase-like protein
MRLVEISTAVNVVECHSKRLPTMIPLLVFGLVLGQAASQPPHTDTAVFNRLEADWNSAHMRGDAAALDRIFADDLLVVVPGMPTMTKAGSLGVFASGRMKFDKYETSETTVRLYEGTAIVTGRLRRTRTMVDRTVDDDWRFTKVYIRRDGQWRVVSFHASNVAP